MIETAYLSHDIRLNGCQYRFFLEKIEENSVNGLKIYKSLSVPVELEQLLPTYPALLVQLGLPHYQVH